MNRQPGASCAPTASTVFPLPFAGARCPLLALLPLAGLVWSAAPVPAVAAPVRFEGLRPGPGLALRFRGDEGSVVVTHGETATFRYEDGRLTMSDGTDEVVIRPIPAPRVRPVPIEDFERMMTMLGVIPRYEELVRHPEGIEAILRRYPMTESLADSLPDVLDPADPRVRRAAYSAYLAERQALVMWPAVRELGDGEGDPVERARRAKRMLEEHPFVYAVEMDPERAESGGLGFVIRWVGEFPDEDGVPVAEYWSSDTYEVVQGWLVGAALRPTPPISEDDARLLHAALARLMAGRAGTIDLSTGWRVELSPADAAE